MSLKIFSIFLLIFSQLQLNAANNEISEALTDDDVTTRDDNLIPISRDSKTIDFFGSFDGKSFRVFDTNQKIFQQNLHRQLYFLLKYFYIFNFQNFSKKLKIIFWVFKLVSLLEVGSVLFFFLTHHFIGVLFSRLVKVISADYKATIMIHVISMTLRSSMLRMKVIYTSRFPKTLLLITTK